MKHISVQAFGPYAVSALALTAVTLMSTAASAQEAVRIGLATQTWWPTVVAETAVRQGLFEGEGLTAELTVYQSGGEAFTALAAGAADIISIQPSIVSTGRLRGVEARMIAEGSDANFGWHLMVPVESEVQDVSCGSAWNVDPLSGGIGVQN